MSIKRISLMTIISGSLIAASCNNPSADKKAENGEDSTTQQTASTAVAPVKYGEADGQEVMQYTLSNAAGMVVKVINYGGVITDIIVPDKDGNKGNVVLSYDSLSGYQQGGNPYFGTIVGRYGNRIAKGTFKLDGQTYTLAINNGKNTLHGGKKGFDKQVWKATPQPGGNSIVLEYTSKDGEEGYPGTLQVQVTYTVTDDNGLKIEYAATTDKATPVNLTQHTYFNLSAGKETTILNHELQLAASGYTPVDAGLIPVGKIAPVKGTAFDFTTSKQIGKEIGQVDGGYDHNFVFDKKGGLEKVGALYDPASGRVMTIATSEPGVQFYTGNFLDGTLTNGRGGAKFPKNAGLCLETQHFPDSPNQPSFPSTILKPGEKYSHTTVYTFGVK